VLAIWSWMVENHMGGVLGQELRVTVGVTPSQGDLLRGTTALCEGRVGENSIWAVLHREGRRLFPDELFADVFADSGRRSVPPSIVATVMVLQKLNGLSDREAVEAFCFDARWKYACGGLDFDYPGFAHTVLVDMRARLARSERPHRIRDVTIDAAREAGLVGVRRVLDSTPLYDAVATMDTITLIRSALRGLFKVTGKALEAELRGVITSGDDYASSAKPQIDWDDAAGREALIDSRAKDALACLALLDGRELPSVVAEAAALVATVVGQDLETGNDGVFRIARKVAKDRVISTVDPEARHGHKTVHRGFDGYKAHTSVDPDSEIVTASTVTPGNAGDATRGRGTLGGTGRSGRLGTRCRPRQSRRCRLWRFRLWHRRVARQARSGPHRPGRQGANTSQLGWALRQGPLRRQPRRQHRHVSERRPGPHRVGQERRPR
jgi:hypothetical protein